MSGEGEKADEAWERQKAFRPRVVWVSAAGNLGVRHLRSKMMCHVRVRSIPPGAHAQFIIFKCLPRS